MNTFYEICKQLRFGMAAVAAAVVGVLLLLSGGPASAQNGDATLDVTVRYPNGALASNVDVCYSYYFVQNGELQGFAGSNSIPGGAQTSLTVNSGGSYAVRAHGCVGSANTLETATWHNEIPAPNSGSLSAPADRLVALDAIVAEPGSNSVDITVGHSRISGTVTGPNATSCTVTVWGTSALSGYYGPVDISSVSAGGAWETWVHPGDYRVEASCFLRSAYEAWPNQAKAGDATTITMAHNGSRSGINFDLNDRFNESTGTHFFLGFATMDEFSMPKCIEAYDTNGTLVRQQIGGAGLGVADNGSYRIKVSDCFGFGFGDRWYPNAPTPAGGEVFVVDGSFFETSLPNAVVYGDDFLTCNGEEITIRGTAGDDTLTGTAERDVIAGLTGNDTIVALGGDDIVCGGDGDDTIFGNAGADWIDAGAGNDWVGAGWGNDEVYGGAGNDFIRGFKHDDFVDGGPGADRIKGGWGNDVLRGGADNDIIRAYYGADKLYGDGGNDVLLGSYGPDLLVGGPGPADRLFGQEGFLDTCNDVGADAYFSGCEKINE